MIGKRRLDQAYDRAHALEAPSYVTHGLVDLEPRLRDLANGTVEFFTSRRTSAVFDWPGWMLEFEYHARSLEMQRPGARRRAT